MKVRTQIIVKTRNGDVYEEAPQTHTELDSFVRNMNIFIEDSTLGSNSLDAEWLFCTTTGIVRIPKEVMRTSVVELRCEDLEEDKLEGGSDLLKLITTTFKNLAG